MEIKNRKLATAIRNALFVAGVIGCSLADGTATAVGDDAVVVQFSDQVPKASEPQWPMATEPQWPMATESQWPVATESQWLEEELPPPLPEVPASGAPAIGGCAHCHGLSRDAGQPKKPHRTMPGDVDRGDCPPARYLMDDCQRAGNPHRVAKWAQPSIGKHYSAWFVGGGAAIGGRGWCPDEGTWGLDYDGWLKPRRVWLNWTGGRDQGGEGAYETEGRTKLLGHD